MILNLLILALIIGLILALNIVSLLPIFVIKTLVRIRVYKQGALGYERYQVTDTNNRTTTRSRYYRRDEGTEKQTCTGRINLVVIAICVLLCEGLALGLYLLMK